MRYRSYPCDVRRHDAASLYFQNARGYNALESGLLMPVTGKLFDKYGTKWLARIDHPM
ncbi:hypothetical protein H1230_24730 [Paenibacillus sp. 19GGS1-52]|uniref:hypothetical protein n=1 Tax=Paenibacillus sp. 19GGS1-52 TaxID=2758563 RepID=UPI001EFB3E47|nr:hypothetical protein [Paenibacillus sp. 19GGS1-52]ULO06213.1 hypothetical protein H1230_24730 [Paenibacillus sp. 19GGS1-52]